MSAIESTSDYAAVLRPDVDNLIFDFVIPTAGHRVVDTEGTLTSCVTQKDFFTKKCGDFTNIYYGKTLTEASAASFPKAIAIKKIRFDPKNMEIGQSIVRMLALANEKWSLLNHPNISPIWLLRSSKSTEPIPAFAMPWFDNGNVLDFTHRHPHINKLNIVKQIANAIGYIHAMGEVHGNIVPANVLIADGGIPCLSDVGMNNRLLKVIYNNGWPVPSGWVFKALEELFPQCDPAVFRNTKAMDVYSFACTIFTIFTSKLPFSPRPYGKGMKEKMAGGRSIEKPAEISSLVWSLLQRCLSYNPDHRPSMAEVELELMMM
ncbi:hypothetical protein PILCRDRAFT_821318 [Piloderma croceum F 1598]|uniref:Protein kinase domain-containing protein n=1 Tax=Piloderma croceum (strain F 1598) TaxID=765440 RepID=A0A0C3BVX8_PILCF|nr:hypothetical protein PILCRDRAFT_821318 [Piloderma croceum F 1598]